MPTDRVPITTTQPDPDLSIEHRPDANADHPTTDEQPNPNLSTEHQAEGDARRPSDTLDKGQPQQAPQTERKTSFT